MAAHISTADDQSCVDRLSISQINDSHHDRIIHLVRQIVAKARRQGEGGLSVDLSFQALHDLPGTLIDISQNDLERLALANNSLSCLPPRLGACVRLRYLNVRHNCIDVFPEPICCLPSLEILDLGYNKLRTVPKEVSKLAKLQVLSLEHNLITTIPSSVRNMTSLRVLQTDGNPLESAPPEILRQPNRQSESDLLVPQQILSTSRRDVSSLTKHPGPDLFAVADMTRHILRDLNRTVTPLARETRKQKGTLSHMEHTQRRAGIYIRELELYTSFAAEGDDDALHGVPKAYETLLSAFSQMCSEIIEAADLLIEKASLSDVQTLLLSLHSTSLKLRFSHASPSVRLGMADHSPQDACRADSLGIRLSPAPSSSIASTTPSGPLPLSDAIRHDYLESVILSMQRSCDSFLQMTAFDSWIMDNSKPPALASGLSSSPLHSWQILFTSYSKHRSLVRLIRSWLTSHGTQTCNSDDWRNLRHLVERYIKSWVTFLENLISSQVAICMPSSLKDELRAVQLSVKRIAGLTRNDRE